MHTPVLVKEFLSLMKETPIPINYFLDGTFGRGGHTRGVMDEFPGVKVVAVDQDQQALDDGVREFCKEVNGGRIHFIHGNFAKIKHQVSELLEGRLFSGILLDLGVSSPQLDEAQRGFSLYKDGPLDMRMDRGQDLLASDIINGWNEGELVELFKNLGDIRRPQKVVRAIVKERQKKKLESTRRLSNLIERVWGWKKKGQHPATQFFLALRLAVNGELQCIKKGIPDLMDVLEEGGRLFVITFHSLEDRIVKNLFKSSQQGALVRKKVIQAQWSEKKQNPRSRSAKLRVFQKGGDHGPQRHQ